MPGVLDDGRFVPFIWGISNKAGVGGGGETTLHHRRHRDMRGVEHGETAVLVWCGAYRDLGNGLGMVVAK